MPAGNPFAYEAVRQRALELKSQALGANLGDLGAYQGQPLSRGKQLVNAFAMRELGTPLFPEPGPGPLPAVSIDDIRAGNPQAEQFLAGLSPAERFILLSQNPETLVELAADSGPLFEQLFAEFPGVSDPALAREAQMVRQRQSGGSRIGGPEALAALEEANALQVIKDKTNRAVAEAQFMGKRGVLSQDRVNQRLADIDALQAAGVEAAQLVPQEKRAGISQSLASAESSRATAERTRVGTEQDVRGPLFGFVDPATGAFLGTAYENSPEAAAFRQQKAAPFNVGALGVAGVKTGDVLAAAPGDKERAQAGRDLRQNTAISQRVAGLFKDVKSNSRAFGPLAELASENRGLALIDTFAPKNADMLNRVLTGMDQSEFAEFRTNMKLLETQLVPPISQETSRYSDSERKMVREIGGVTAGTGPSAFRGKMAAINGLTILNDDKLAMIAGAPGAIYSNSVLDTSDGQTEAGKAVMQMLKDRGYEGRELLKVYKLIREQRKELVIRGAEAIGGSLDELVGGQ